LDEIGIINPWTKGKMNLREVKRQGKQVKEIKFNTYF
jgi:hypothetical protein